MDFLTVNHSKNLMGGLIGLKAKKNIKEIKDNSRAEILASKYPLSLLELVLSLKQKKEVATN